MVIRLTLLLALLVSPLGWAYSNLSASLDSNPVRMGHSFVLNVVADDEVSADALDTSPLEQAFTILRNNVSRSTQIVNFDARRETHWQLLLTPKRTGTLTIPPLTAGRFTTQAIALTVVAENAKLSRPDTVFLEASLTEEEVWLGQPVDYQVRLYLAADLQRGSLMEPKLEGADIAQMGQDSNTTEMRNGIRYRVIERHYLITPHKVGDFQVQGAYFSGDILRAGRSNDLFSRAVSTPVQVMGDPLPLAVKAPPAAFTAPWLVANAVALNEEWNPEQLQVRVGDPLTRTLTLTAVGATESALPRLAPDYPSGLKSYPDKEERSDQVHNREVVARLRQSTALVASAPGTYTLPEIRVAWWNAKLNRQEWATLPARTLTVQPAQGQASPQPKLSAPVQTPAAGSNDQPNPWFYSTLALTAALALSLLWGWRRGGARPPVPAPAATGATPPPSRFDEAVAENDLTATLQALPARLSGLRGPVSTLAQVRGRFPELVEELESLQQSAFSREGKAADLRPLAQLVSRLKHEKDEKQPRLPELNPR